MVEQISNAHSIRLDDSKDIYESINDFDLLITDYSSIFFDFLITGKPIVHAPFDLEEYKHQNRELYFEYEEIYLTPGIASWKDIIDLILNFKMHGIPSDYIARYRALKNRFNQFADNYSSRRVYEWVLGHSR